MVVEVNNILRILREALDALETQNSQKLRILSDQTVHSSSTAQDSSNIAIAVIVYSLSKIVERKYFQNTQELNSFYGKVIDNLEDAIEALEKKNEYLFKEKLKGVRIAVENLPGDFKNYVEDVFRKAKINKASKIYEHGISMEQTAKMLGISLWELASYSGGKEIPDAVENKTISIKQRIKYLESIF